MTTASIPELRKAHTRTRAQLTRAAVRYGKRALARRGSGEDGPPSDQEVALLRELLAAAVMATPATALGRCHGSQPRSTVEVVVGSVPAGHGQSCWGSGGDHRGWEGIAGGGDRCLRTWTAPAAPGPARRLTMPATGWGFHQPHHLRLEVNHIVGLSDDGEHEVRNLQLLCPYCNRVKGTQGSLGFRMKMTELRAHNVGTGVMVDEREARSHQGNGNVGTRRVFWCPISVVQPTEK